MSTYENLEFGSTRAGAPDRLLVVIDEMIVDGRLVYNADRNIVEVGAYPRKAHRPRPRLLRQTGYVAFRQQLEDLLAAGVVARRMKSGPAR